MAGTLVSLPQRERSLEEGIIPSFLQMVSLEQRKCNILAGACKDIYDPSLCL